MQASVGFGTHLPDSCRQGLQICRAGKKKKNIGNLLDLDPTLLTTKSSYRALVYAPFDLFDTGPSGELLCPSAVQSMEFELP